MKTLLIFAVGITLLAVGCSHSSGEDASTFTPFRILADTPTTTFGTELVVPPTFVTLPNADFERKIEELQEDGASTEEVFFRLSPGSSEWNTLVVQEAEIYKPLAIRFNKCSTSLDVFYDFENSVTNPIERTIELSLRYSFEFLSTMSWWINFEALDFSVEESESSFENLEEFYRDLNTILSGILGDRNIQSVFSEFTYETLPALKQGFADIGFESSDATISKFQETWAVNPEMERATRISLRLIEITEATLLDAFEKSNGVFSEDFSRFYTFLFREFHIVAEGDPTIELENIHAPLPTNEELKKIVASFLESIAKPSAPSECIDSARPWFPKE